MFAERNEVSFEATGQTVSVPNHDAARLMYYLNCVFAAIELDDDPDIQRYIDYQNYYRLSASEQFALMKLCELFSPDVLIGKVFFESDELCDDSNNEFYTISEVQSRLFASDSIIIAGQQRHVNKIMTYKKIWMLRNYFDPMIQLGRQLLQGSSGNRVTNYGSTYNSTPVQQITYVTPTPAVVYTYPQQSTCSSRRTWCWVLIIIVGISIIIGIINGVIHFSST